MKVADHKYTFAALDLGGTKTDAVLFTENGDVISHVIGPGGTSLEWGIVPSLDRMCVTLDRVLAAADGRVDVLYAAIACSNFCHDETEKALRPRYPQIPRLIVDGDGPSMISAMLGHRDGACMICGTGASLCLRRGDDVRFIGGWGYLIDSRGSGYVLGRWAIRRALMANDGRMPPTLLTDLLEKRCGEPIQDHIFPLYQGGRAYIASMAGTVFEARAAGDEAAAEIFNEGVRTLSDLVYAACREMNAPYELVLNGGIFANFPEYAEALKAMCPPSVSVLFSDAPPVFGGAVEAMAAAGLTPGADFKRRFLAGL